MDAISVNQLSKYYGKARALEEVSFTISEGRLVGFLGPTGSGKSAVATKLCQRIGGEIISCDNRICWF